MINIKDLVLNERWAFMFITKEEELKLHLHKIVVINSNLFTEYNHVKIKLEDYQTIKQFINETDK